MKKSFKITLSWFCHCHSGVGGRSSLGPRSVEADELVQRARAHARGQRRLGISRLLPAQIEQGRTGG